MITKNVDLTLNADSAKLSSKLVVYREDGDFAFKIRIKNNPYIFDNDDNSFLASVVIEKPSGAWFEIIDLPTPEKDTVVVEVYKDYIDELNEVGTHKFQLRLHSGIDENYDYIDAVTLPEFQVIVKSRLIDKK